MANNDHANERNSVPEQGEMIQLYGRLKSLENVLTSWHKEQERNQAKKEHRFRRFIVQLVIVSTTVIGVLWTLVEMGAWYLDQLQKEKMAERYNAVANGMYEQENNPDVALQMLEQSIALNDTFETRYQFAYIKGMKAVQVLLNLDRPFTKDELNMAHQSLADAKFLVQLEPDRPEGYILESQIYTALKEYGNAENAIQQALKIEPDHAFAQVRYATLLYNLKKFDDARTVIEKVVSAYPDYKWGYLWYGLVLDALKQKENALVQFEKAIKLDPKFDTAIYNLGCSYLNSRPRNFAKARECFQRVLTINPAYKQAYYQLGMSYGYEDRYDVALTYMDKAIALSEDYLTARNWKALVLFEMKRYEEAIQAYSAAIMLDPRNDELYVRRAAAKVDSKQFDAAVNDLNFALELNPQNTEAVMILSNLYLETGNTELALAKIDHALNAAKNDKALSADLWNLRAKLWQKKGDFTAAVADQKKAVECFKSKYTLYYLALYQKRGNMNGDALKTLDEIHQVDPRFSAAWKLRADLLKDQDKAAALKAVETYLTLKPQDKKMQDLKKELEKK